MIGDKKLRTSFLAKNSAFFYAWPIATCFECSKAISGLDENLLYHLVSCQVRNLRHVLLDDAGVDQ